MTTCVCIVLLWILYCYLVIYLFLRYSFNAIWSYLNCFFISKIFASTNILYQNPCSICHIKPSFPSRNPPLRIYLKKKFINGLTNKGDLIYFILSHRFLCSSVPQNLGMTSCAFASSPYSIISISTISRVAYPLCFSVHQVKSFRLAST